MLNQKGIEAAPFLDIGSLDRKENGGLWCGNYSSRRVSCVATTSGKSALVECLLRSLARKISKK